MAAKPAVKVEGARELQRALREMAGNTRDLTKVNKQAAQPVLEEARKLVPVVSGTLRRSIRVSARAKGAAVLAGKNTVPYAGPIHYGWPRRNIEAQPFLIDALAEKRQAVIDTYELYIGQLVVKVDVETPG